MKSTLPVGRNCPRLMPGSGNASCRGWLNEKTVGGILLPASASSAPTSACPTSLTPGGAIALLFPPGTHGHNLVSPALDAAPHDGSPLFDACPANARRSPSTTPGPAWPS